MRGERGGREGREERRNGERERERGVISNHRIPFHHTFINLLSRHRYKARFCGEEDHKLAHTLSDGVTYFLSNLFCQFEPHGTILVVYPSFVLVTEYSLGMVDLLELCVCGGGGGGGGDSFIAILTSS